MTTGSGTDGMLISLMHPVLEPISSQTDDQYVMRNCGQQHVTWVTWDLALVTANLVTTGHGAVSLLMRNLFQGF